MYTHVDNLLHQTDKSHIFNFGRELLIFIKFSKSKNFIK